MSFLEELQNNPKPENTQKTPRQLWESCYKYFQHLVKILNENQDTFEAEYTLILLNNLQTKCTINGPFSINRTQDDTNLKLEVKFITFLEKDIGIKRKDLRSAELLRTRLNKDGILSTIKKDQQENYKTVITPKIQSQFSIILLNNTHFEIHYLNINSSAKRIIKLPVKNIDEKNMDQIAKFILGQNPDLYKESISDQEITAIRKKIEQDKLRKKIKEEEIQAEIAEQKRQKEIKKANSLKEKSKRFLNAQSQKLKYKLKEKIDQIKHK